MNTKRKGTARAQRLERLARAVSHYLNNFHGQLADLSIDDKEFLTAWREVLDASMALSHTPGEPMSRRFRTGGR